jgi:menaquinone-dependent protoporphyrinogen oxidase
MTKALIVYGTRYGETASTSEEIANVIRKEGIEVRVVNAKEEKVNDIAEYDLVIVGSGIQINKWTGKPEKFLKKFQKELAKKKVALFVCCGSSYCFVFH